GRVTWASRRMFRPSAYTKALFAVSSSVSFPASLVRRRVSGPSSINAFSSTRGVWGAVLGAAGRLSVTMTTPAKTSTNRAIARRAMDCQRISESSGSSPRSPCQFVLRELVHGLQLETGNWELETRKLQAIIPVQRPDVADVELQVGFPLIFVAVEREGQVDTGAVLLEELGAFRGAPGDRLEPAALLAEGHLQVTLLQRAGAID